MILWMKLPNCLHGLVLSFGQTQAASFAQTLSDQLSGATAICSEVFLMRGQNVSDCLAVR